jgi:hypothetical protein
MKLPAVRLMPRLQQRQHRHRRSMLVPPSRLPLFLCVWLDGLDVSSYSAFRSSNRLITDHPISGLDTFD